MTFMSPSLNYFTGRVFGGSPYQEPFASLLVTVSAPHTVASLSRIDGYGGAAVNVFGSFLARVGARGRTALVGVVKFDFDLSAFFSSSGLGAWVPTLAAAIVPSVRGFRFVC